MYFESLSKFGEIQIFALSEKSSIQEFSACNQSLSGLYHSFKYFCWMFLLMF